MWAKILPPIVITILDWAYKKIVAYLKEMQKRERIKRGAKRKIEKAKAIRDRKDKAKRINTIINN